MKPSFVYREPAKTRDWQIARCLTNSANASLVKMQHAICRSLILAGMVQLGPASYTKAQYNTTITNILNSVVLKSLLQMSNISIVNSTFRINMYNNFNLLLKLQM